MDITKSTYIDTLQRLRLVSSVTRNNCVDRMIFTVGDLERFADSNGRISIRGFSNRSILELQSVWDKVKKTGSNPVDSLNKPRNLVRILSEEEKSAISELENLFESTYLSGGSRKSDITFMSVDSIEGEHPVATPQTKTESIDPSSDRLKAQMKEEFVAELSEMHENYLRFVIKHHRRPSLMSNGDEQKLARWYEVVLKFEEDDSYKKIVGLIKEGSESLLKMTLK